MSLAKNLTLLLTLLLLCASSYGQQDVMFGLANQYNNGIDSSIALNANNLVVEAHKSETNDTLWYHTGTIDGSVIRWNKSYQYGSGLAPSVALNRAGIAIATHEGNNLLATGLWCHVGVANGKIISWGKSHKYCQGRKPAVAINDNGVVVAVHQHPSSNSLLYTIGQVNVKTKTILWEKSRVYAEGTTPTIAINNSGLLVAIHKSPNKNNLWYHTGKIIGGKIHWGPGYKYQDGIQPTVAIADNGLVITLHESAFAGTLWKSVGRVQGNKITWSNSSYFDNGQKPAVATNGKFAIQTHQSENWRTLWYSNSLVIDRANWMSKNLAIQNKTIKDITFPGSHDAGMYTGDIFGLTQDRNLYLQLHDGIRYFDLRCDSDFNIRHGITYGPKLQDVLHDVNRYMSEGHRELVILKFSHYQNFNSEAYNKLIKMVLQTLGTWLFTQKTTTRLANLPLQKLIGNGGKVLVVCDGKYPIHSKFPGIYTYRDWDSADPENGDITVYDMYANTTDYGKMKNDQFQKYRQFNGKCKRNANVPCDLFLLSWTLTPLTAVWSYSKQPNRNLGQELNKINSNKFGLRPNVVYVDYCQYSRVTDICILMNSKLKMSLK